MNLQTFTIIAPIIANVFGIETDEVRPTTSFHLDLNAAPEDMDTLKEELEMALDIVLPKLTPEEPSNVAGLLILLEDTML